MTSDWVQSRGLGGHSPEEVLLAIGQGEEGRLVSWSPGGIQELASIPGRPDWIRRMGDDRLWMLVRRPNRQRADLWAWDGATLEEEPGVPAGRGMHLAPDGELWAIEEQNGPDVLHRRDATGNWTVLSDEVASALVGHGHQMWAAWNGRTWKRDCRAVD